MFSEAKSIGALLRRCALLFLALSVFWFGLHARIQAFTTATSNLTASKISIEKNSAKVLKALEKQDSPTDDADALILGLFFKPFDIEVAPLPLSEVAKIELADPRRLDLGGVYSLHGPPATNLQLALRGHFGLRVDHPPFDGGNRLWQQLPDFGVIHEPIQFSLGLHWWRPMLKHTLSETGFLDRGVPLDLSSILLVEPNPELRDSRRLLLGTLRHPVLAVSAYPEVCALPADSNCALIAIDLTPNEHEAFRIATLARRTWPTAKILLLGQPSEHFDDPLYDDVVSPWCNPSGIVECADKLLRERVPRYQQVAANAKQDLKTGSVADHSRSAL